MVYLGLEDINPFRSIQWFLGGLMTENLSFQSLAINELELITFKG